MTKVPRLSRPRIPDIGPASRNAPPANHGPCRLYYSTFSRTVWRLYDGAKGLVMWYCLGWPLPVIAVEDARSEFFSTAQHNKNKYGTQLVWLY